MQAETISGQNFISRQEEIMEAFEKGRVELAQQCPEGVLPSLAIIRKFCSNLNTNDIIEFSSALGALDEYVTQNPFRSGVVLGQNPNVIQWLHKYSEVSFFATSIMKIVGYISSSIKFCPSTEERIASLFVDKAGKYLEESTSHGAELCQYSLLVWLGRGNWTEKISEGILEGLFKEGKKFHEGVCKEKATLSLSYALNSLPQHKALLMLPKVLALSLIFQPKTEFIFPVQPSLEQLIKSNKDKAILILTDLLQDEKELYDLILSNCTKFRSVYFISSILGLCSRNLKNSFFDKGGREVYFRMLRRCELLGKVPKIYIFLEDEGLIQSLDSESEKLIIDVTNRIINEGTNHQLSDKISLFKKALFERRNKRDNNRPEYNTVSKVFKEKETAEIVMKGLVTNIWREETMRSNNLVIEVKNKLKKRSVEIDLSSPGLGSARSNKSSKSFFFGDTQDEDPVPQPKFQPELQLESAVSSKLPSLYSYDYKKELWTKDINELMESHHLYNKKLKRMELGQTNDIRLVYHRRIDCRRKLYFALQEVDTRQDKIVLQAAVYSPHTRKLFYKRVVKVIERLEEGRPYYEKDFVTLCKTNDDFKVVLLDKVDGVYKLLYFSLMRRGEIKEFVGLEEIFSSRGIQFDTRRTFSLASGMNRVIVGCRHMLAIFGIESKQLVFKATIPEIGFGISRIRLLDIQANLCLVLGYAAREFCIINLDFKKIYHFVFEWLQANQVITEVEIDENIMIYLIEDSKRRCSSLYLKGEEESSTPKLAK
jgi:hypothetical protein